MKRKLMSVLLILVLIIGYLSNSLILTARAIEVNNKIYQVTKIKDSKQNSVQIKFHVREDIHIIDITLPDQTKVERELNQYIYTAFKNGSYDFVLRYQQNEIKEEVIHVEVTELDESTRNIKQELKGLYVSSEGDDTYNGSKETPFKTLNKAVEIAKNNDTIYLLGDVILNQSIRIVNKSLTIDGQGHMVKRGDIETVQDNARSTYNPAMFELNNWNQNNDKHVLTFKNIILDDQGKAKGSIYTQQSTNGTFDNENKVQDAIIACYTSNKIILDAGTILQNYGGLSAVRLTSKALLEMKHGSTIKDTQIIERGHSTSDTVTGQIAAIWLQDGLLEMHSGSEITDIIGRAIMVDSGTANIDGTISNINGRASMWYNAQGIAIHIRGEGKTTLSGKISHIKANVVGNDEVVAIRNNGCFLETTSQSKIEYVENIPVLFAHYSEDLLGGIIEKCTNDYLIRATYNDMIFKDTSFIRNNKCRKGDASAVVYSTNGAHYIMNGQMINNDAKYAFYIINHGGKYSELIMNKGAKIIGKDSDTGVYINASGSKFIMNGGEIAHFDRGVYCRGKEKSSATFMMNDGIIHHNKSTALYFDATNYSDAIVKLNGGSIVDNEQSDFNIYNGLANNQNEHLSLKSLLSGNQLRIKLGNASKLFSFDHYTLLFDKNYPDFKIGNAHSDAVKCIQELVTKNPKYKGWSVVGKKAIWIKPTTSEFQFKLERPYQTSKTGLFVTYIPLNADGTPPKGAELVKMEEVNNDNMINIHLTGLKPHTAYAIMLVNNDIYTLNPDNVVKYIGGGHGEETSESSFPFYTLTDCIDRIKSLEINGIDTGLKGQKALDKLYDYLDITVFNEQGYEVTSDNIAGNYIGRLSYKNPYTSIRINGNDVNFSKEGGSLIVRNTSNKEGAISGEITYPLLNEEPTEYLKHPVAIAKKPDNGQNRFYINNDKDRKVINTEGISLFADELLRLDDSDNRQKLLENKAKDYLGIKDQLGYKSYFDFHYLDLVDAFDGNVWVTASHGTTVYLPYPEGTDQTTEFSLVHFKGLHREYEIRDYNEVINAINDCDLEKMPIEKTDVGIKFFVDSSGFSPFVLVWSEDTGTSDITLQYIDKETKKPLAKEITKTFTVNEQYDVSQLVAKEIKGYHVDRINGEVKGNVGQDDIVITVLYANSAPVLYGNDINIAINSSFDPLDHVTANDYEDGDITENIIITHNNVNLAQSGTYEVTYAISDLGGKTTKLTIQVVVSDAIKPILPSTPNSSMNSQKSVLTGDQKNILSYFIIASIGLAIAGVIIYKKD